MTLREKQSEFLHCLSRFIQWAFDQGFEFTLGEGYVGDTDARDGDYDGPHLRHGGHYKRLAVDLNLWLNGKWIQDGGHPAWTVLGRKWTSLDTLARWGGDFKSRDSNHFSFEDGGVA